MADYCRYCYRFENGDYPYDTEWLIMKKINYRFSFSQNGKEGFRFSGHKQYSTNVFIEDGKLVLAQFDEDCDEVVNESVNINYCPMCGKKLERSNK